MGDLQGEFDFFIKNQQAKEEKKLPPSPLALVLPFHVSFFPKCCCQTPPSRFLSIVKGRCVHIAQWGLR